MRVVKLVLGFFAFSLYAWYEAVQRTPEVKRRKARRRALRNPDRA
jgi:hypothetical protein